MPTYAYKCRECGHTFDAFHSISADPLKECPECKTASLQLVPSGGVFQLQGSGWYAQGYSSSGEIPHESSTVSSPSSGCCPCGKNSGSCSIN